MFELVQSMTAPVKRKCPACGQLALERLIGIGAGFIIKGGAATAKADAAERAAEAASQKAAAKEATGESSSTASDVTAQSPDAPSSDSAASASTDAKQGSVSEEKKISGSTSTPTHAAREGRGVGNLVDKARRHSRESTARPAGKASKKKAKKSTGKKQAKSPRKKKT